VGLYAILKAIGVGPGDCIAVPGYTCVVVPAAVRYLGAEPVYVDIDCETYNISLDHLEATVQAGAEGRIKAIVLQHTYGLPADTATIVQWAGERGIAVIEDCAHAVGSRYRDSGGGWHDVGTLGEAGFFSSQWSKPFTTGLGGWAVTNNPELTERIQKFHSAECVAPGTQEVARLAVQLLAHDALVWPSLYWVALGSYRLLARTGLFVGSSTEGELAGVMPVDYAKRMSGLQEWVGRRKIANLGRVLDHRRKLKRLYDDALAAASLPILRIPAYADPVLVRYPIRVADKGRVLAEARRLCLELGDWFNHPLHPKGANVGVLGWRDGMCPEGEQAAREVVNLPMHSRIGERDVERAVRFLGPYAISRNAAA
jgi:dTDP-4-amino-4,6-dideoxygalactose transaminase